MNGQPDPAGLVVVKPEGVAAPVGLYSHGVLAPASGRWLHISGQIGLRADGRLAPDFMGQAETAWENLFAVLHAAGMDSSHLIKITTFLTDGGQLPQFAPVRARFLGDARPASTLLIVKALARPEWLVEIEAVACDA